jgi:hypothetical protein
MYVTTVMYCGPLGEVKGYERGRRRKEMENCVRVSSFHLSFGSILGSGTSCELSWLLVLSLATRVFLPCHEGFSPGSLVFLPP